MYIMLYKDDVYDSVLDPFDVLNESIYLTMDESTIHSDMIPIIENNRLNTYLTESTYNHIPNTTVILDESDIIEDPTITQDYTDYVIRPINEQHNEYQYVLECIDTWIDNDYDDNLLLEMVLLEVLDDKTSEDLGRMWFKHQHRSPKNAFEPELRFARRARKVNKEFEARIAPMRKKIEQIADNTKLPLEQKRRYIRDLREKIQKIDFEIGEKYGYELNPGQEGKRIPTGASNVQAGMQTFHQRAGERSMRAITRLTNYLNKNGINQENPTAQDRENFEKWKKRTGVTDDQILSKRKLKELEARVRHADSQLNRTTMLIDKIKKKENRDGYTEREHAIFRALHAKQKRAQAGLNYFKKNGLSNRITKGDLQAYYHSGSPSGQIGGKEDSNFIDAQVEMGDNRRKLARYAKERIKSKALLKKNKEMLMAPISNVSDDQKAIDFKNEFYDDHDSLKPGSVVKPKVQELPKGKPAGTPPPKQNTPTSPPKEEHSSTPLEDNKGKPAGTPPTPPPKQDTPPPTPPKEEHSSTPLEDNKGKPAGTPPKQDSPVVPSNNNNQSRLSRATTLMKNNKGKIGLGVGLAVGAGLAYKNRDKLKSLATKGWENYQQYKNRPKSVIAKRIAALRGVYKKFMLEAQRNPKQSNVFKRMAAKILSVIDKLLGYLQNKADNTNRAYNPNY